MPLIVALSPKRAGMRLRSPGTMGSRPECTTETCAKFSKHRQSRTPCDANRTNATPPLNQATAHHQTFQNPRPQVLNKSSSSVFGPRSSQIGYCRSTGVALVEPCSFMFKRSVISHKKPIGLPRSTAPDKNIRVFVARDFEHFSHRYFAYGFAELRSRLFKIVLISQSAPGLPPRPVPFSLSQQQ